MKRLADAIKYAFLSHWISFRPPAGHVGEYSNISNTEFRILKQNIESHLGQSPALLEANHLPHLSLWGNYFAASGDVEDCFISLVQVLNTLPQFLKSIEKMIRLDRRFCEEWNDSLSDYSFEFRSGYELLSQVASLGEANGIEEVQVTFKRDFINDFTTFTHSIQYPLQIVLVFPMESWWLSTKINGPGS